MEFEDNQPTDDEQRRLAEAKKVTLQPLHTDITPDPIPDAEIAARSTQEASPNTTNDTEDTNVSHLIQPSKSALNKTSVTKPATPPASQASTIALFITILAAVGATAWLWTQAG